MAVVNKFNVNKEQVILDADIIENMSANDVSYNSSLQYDENTVGNKLSELEQQVIYDVTKNNDGVNFASLSALLSDENISTLIPVSVRCGGMSIRFVQSSGNMYVQFRYMSTSTANADFLNVDNWQGVDDEPTDNSDNLVKSNGVFGLNERILDSVGNFRVEFSTTQVRYRIKLDGSMAGTDAANLYRIYSVPSYYKKIVVLSDCANDSLCVAFYNSNSLNTSTFISGVAGQNRPILSEYKLGYYEVDIPQGTVMIVITCVNLNGRVPKAVLGANGSYPKEITVAKSDIKNIEGSGEENIISQKTTTESLNNIREVADIVKYSDTSSVYKEGWLNGNVGDAISIIDRSDKKYAIIPFEKTGILKYHKYYSSLNNAAYFLDNNDIILAKSPIITIEENDTEYMNCIPEGTKKVAFNCSDISSSSLINYLITCDRFLYPAVFEQGGVLANGTVNKESTVQKYAKINVKGSKYLMADVKNYGAKKECYLISFYSENGTFISHKYPNISSDSSHIVFVAAEVPKNAAYAYVMTRADYVNNAKVYVDNYTIALEDELNFYKKNGELSNKKVYDYYNTTFIAGEPVGNVGETISYDTSSANSYHVEFDCKGFTCIEWSSRAFGDVYFVDENDVILKKLPQRVGTRIDVFDGAAKFIVYVHREYRIVFNATLYNYDIVPIESSIGFNGLVENGEFKTQILETSGEVTYNRQYNNFISFKIFTEGLEVIFAKIRNYSGTPTSVFSFWDKNGNYLSDYIKMNGANNEEYVGAIIPTNSHYCIVTSRQYDVKLFADKKPVAEKLINEKGYITLSPTYNYSGNTIKLQRNNFTIGRIGQPVVPQYITIDNVNLGGQGMAIFGDVMFKFYNKGYYNVYKICEGLQLKYINQFHLGSYGDNQHANNCQFSTIMSDTGYPYLYVGSAASPLITVEKVSTSTNGVLVQTIDISSISSGYNVGIDENYLWLFGGNMTTLKVLKFNIPSLTESEVILTEDNALDSFEYPHNYNIDGQIQGGKIYNNKLYWVFGANRQYHPGEWKRALYVFDLKNKVRESFVDLSDVFEHELEDFEIYGNIGLISINNMANIEESHNGNGLYFIKFD